MTKKKTQKTRSKAKTTSYYIKLIWKLFVLGIVLMLSPFVLASFGLLGFMPDFNDLENPENKLATQVISADGKIIGTYADENRTPIAYKDIPENIIKALIATEDERFYEHSGIDATGTARAVLTLGKDGGGSTITQQLAKLTFHKRESAGKIGRLLQKVKEYVISIRLERQYTKEEILTMYLNKFDFLFRANGIASASRIYFGKDAKELKIEEAATLVAMLKNPRQYNPKREISKEKSLKRRNVVLKQMEKNEFITTAVKDSLQQLPIKLNFSPEQHSDGLATYFRMYLQKTMQKWIKENPKPDGTFYNLHSDGLKIYTTIDSRMQEYAEEATQEHMANLQRVFFKQQKKNKTAPFYDLSEDQIKRIIDRGMKNSDRWKRLKKAGKSEEYIRKVFDTKTDMRVFSWKGDRDTIMTPKDSVRYYKYFMRAGMLSIEPQTGHVKAWVGGINYKHFQYDMVKKGKRQVGSTFKPFVYASAINQLQLSPCTKYPNVPHTIPAGKYGLLKPWTPMNASGDYGEELTLKEAMAGSVNVITAKLIDEVGPSTVANLANKSGITSKIDPLPSIALGTVDLSLFEMVGAYTTFANSGQHNAPIMVERIEDKNGTVLADFVTETREVISEESAYVLLDIMKGVTEYGSGARLRGWTRNPDKMITGHPYKFTNPIAGKTGTTQNQSDGWFMGTVPNLTTGVWVGGEDRATHFADIGRGQGASMALPIWALFYKKCYADSTLHISKKDFKKPSNLSIEIDCDKYTDKGGDTELEGEENKEKEEEELDF